ncbi:MAG: hypothetical protein HYU78_07005 [Rhodocyclales bacterium]|nr:hypothetical protein [Rhodocyclales bacterium]
MRAARLALLLAAAATSLPAAAAANILCCNDERGKQVCGDILPAACVGRAYREIGANGVVVRQVDAPLTPEQRALRAAEERKKKEAEEAANEQRRLDSALLQTYGSEADIDLMRQRAEADTLAGIKAAEAKIVEAKKRRKKFEDEAEFYKKRTLPPEIEKGLKDADFDIQAQQELIGAKQKELGAIKAKYDEDKRRYQELKRVRVRQ